MENESYMIFQLTIRIDNAQSQVVVGESYLNLSKYLPAGRQIIIITDENILKHYGVFFRTWPVIEIGTGEKIKTIDTLMHIYQRLLDCNADRNSFVVAVGGGIVCDVAGFAASTYMRGLPFGFVSTTLLSQVDASVGGKNGVNFSGYKNMIGTFSQPHFVLCDTAMLRTLPDKEFVAGFAEILKAAAVRDAGLFDYLEQNAEKATARDPEVIRHLVVEAVKIKADVVEHDEREQGERRILNFGHTFGHAVEVLTGVSHGEAVSIGMMMAAQWSANEYGFPQSQVDRIRRLLLQLRLPITTHAQPEDILRILLKDKKRENDTIHLVLLSEIGKATIHKTPIQRITQFIIHHL